MSDDPARQLEYAQPLPWHRRGKFARRLIMGAVVLMLLLSWKWIPFVWQRAQVLLWQHECMSYALPQGTTIYTYDPSTTQPTTAPAQPPPPLVPAAWQSLHQAVFGSGVRSDGTLLLHRMTRKDGVERLIAVDLAVIPQATQVRYEAIVRALRPGSLLRQPAGVIQTDSALTHQISSAHPLITLPASQVVRFLHGQVDPKNSSHFILELEMSGQKHLIDGWILPDPRGDRVVLEPRVED